VRRVCTFEPKERVRSKVTPRNGGGAECKGGPVRGVEVDVKLNGDPY